MWIATLNLYLWVAVGGALGSMCRFGLALAVLRLTGPRFPWGILLINVLGSFIIGWFGAFSTLHGRWPAPAEIRAFVLVGVCGGFTTFSSFSLNTFDLFRAGETLLGAINVLASVVLCLLGVWLGVALGQR